MSTIFSQGKGRDWKRTELRFSTPRRAGEAQAPWAQATWLDSRQLRMIRTAGADFIDFIHDGDGGLAMVVDGHADVLVNGETVPGSIRILRHQDEIVVGGHRYFYSGQSLPRVEVYHGQADRPLRCPVCRQDIEDGQPTVRCPGNGCGRIYHEITGEDGAPIKPCWTYNQHCAVCNHPTSLSPDAAWTPGILDAEGGADG